MIKHHSALLYSPFGVGKSALLSELVRVLLPKGTRARLYTVENYDAYKDLINDGLLEVWSFKDRDQPFETSNFAADGYFPDASGNLVAPTPDIWAKYPIRIYEGLATVANYVAGSSVKGALAQRIGAGESVGPTDSGEAIRLVDGTTEVGGLSRSNYGFVQKWLTSWVQRCQKKPGHVFHTAHEDDVKEKRGGVATGNTIIGPECFGGALTGTIGREFSDVFRLVAIPHDYVREDQSVARVIERRLYVKEHVDPLSQTLVGKARNSAGLNRQKDLAEYYRLTDEQGLPRDGVAKVIVDKLGWSL